VTTTTMTLPSPWFIPTPLNPQNEFNSKIDLLINPASFLLDNENIPHQNHSNDNTDLKSILSHIGLLFLGRDYSVSIDHSTVSDFIESCNSFQTALQNRDDEMRDVIDGY
jgi:hypothetical protein